MNGHNNNNTPVEDSSVGATTESARKTPPSTMTYVLHPYLIRDHGLAGIFTAWCKDANEVEVFDEEGEEGRFVSEPAYGHPMPVLYARAIGTTIRGLSLWLVLIQGATRPCVLVPLGSPESDYMTRWEIQMRNLCLDKSQFAVANTGALKMDWDELCKRELTTRKLVFSNGPAPNPPEETPSPMQGPDASEVVDHDDIESHVYGATEDGDNDEVFVREYIEEDDDDAFAYDELYAEEEEAFAENLQEYAFRSMGDEFEWICPTYTVDWDSHFRDYVHTYRAPMLPEMYDDRNAAPMGEEEEEEDDDDDEYDYDDDVLTPYSDPSVFLSDDDPAVTDTVPGWARITSQRAAKDLAHGVHSWMVRMGLTNPSPPVLPTTLDESKTTEQEAVTKTVSFDVDPAPEPSLPPLPDTNHEPDEEAARPPPEAPLEHLRDPRTRSPSLAERELVQGDWYCMTVSEFAHWRLIGGLPIIEASLLRGLEQAAVRRSLPSWLSTALIKPTDAQSLSAAMRKQSQELLALADTQDEMVMSLSRAIAATSDSHDDKDAKNTVNVPRALWSQVTTSLKELQASRNACFQRHTPME